MTKSLPAWGAWIEIRETSSSFDKKMSLPAWGAWIEIRPSHEGQQGQGSLPAWGAWIEIASGGLAACSPRVAPRMGSVD